MKLCGYADDGLPIEEIVPAVLAEVMLSATPAELFRIAEFLTLCSQEMERMGSKYAHVHLSDRLKEFVNSPHFVDRKRGQ